MVWVRTYVCFVAVELNEWATYLYLVFSLAMFGLKGLIRLHFNGAWLCDYLKESMHNWRHDNHDWIDLPLFVC